VDAAGGRPRRASSEEVAQETGKMRVLMAGLLVLIAVNGCAALKKTEDLPVPTDSRSLQGGPEGENLDSDGL
jgi:hypothetical protein